MGTVARAKMKGRAFLYTILVILCCPMVTHGFQGCGYNVQGRRPLCFHPRPDRNLVTPCPAATVLALSRRSNNEIVETKEPTPLKFVAAFSRETLDNNAFYALVLVASIAIHWTNGWNPFLHSVGQLISNASSEETSSVLTFWLFGVLSHAIVKPIFGISEVMHASPGPRLGGLVPFSFLVGCSALVGSFVVSEKLRKVVSVGVLASLLNFVGMGLDGSNAALLGADYNIQLDDPYKTGDGQIQVVKGCPSPEAIRSVSVDPSFDYQKYAGRWYWQSVHDWTQFSEMYDTTLDIQLIQDHGTSKPNGYINTLTLKGPSPVTSPLSWDKSPLMIGVRYSWRGTIDNSEKAIPGVSQEAGFGVTFPNYIVDVVGGEDGRPYQELIQFQCIEAGGVRVYEGIDFMTRTPTVSESSLEAMHRRATAAGLDPYGSSKAQMHRIERATEPAQPNEWQMLWKKLAIERYLDQSLGQ